MDWTSSMRVCALAGVPPLELLFYSSVQKNLPFGAGITRPHSRWISIPIHYTGENVSGVYSPVWIVKDVKVVLATFSIELHSPQK